ncbi:MAG: 50S ribosomal protein L6 [Deltaproteobacteria bacterium]|jgi:large subunit ribosomal protein L6|nr:50S ribosomal protein L6 [Deltaproteobacteria bacterium]
MSRIGKRPIPIAKGVEVKMNGDMMTVKGPKGVLQRRIHNKIKVEINDENLLLSVSDNHRETRAIHGLFGALVLNMVTGVTKGFERALEIVGVGYRAELKGRTTIFNLGYSNPVHFELPDGIDANVEKNKILLMGIDKELLGRTAAKIRSLRKPEPYKGKGIKYADEMIRRKAGKAGAAA